MDKDFAYYVIRYCGHLMNAQEKQAYSHLAATMKATGRDDVAAQEEAKSSKIQSRWLSTDPDVLRLAHNGYQAFLANTASRILTEQGDQVFLNLCPKCGSLAKTPKARQCRVCKYDWHASKNLTE